jgi:hypothetical protein
MALALALGFGYLRWRQGGFDWLNAGNKRSAPASDVSQNNASPSPDSSSAAAPPAPDNSTSQSAGGKATPAPNSAAAPPDSTTTQTTPSQNPAADSSPKTNTTQDASPNPAQKPADTATPSASTSPAGADPSPSTESTAPAPKVEPKVKERKPAPAKPAAAPLYDSVAEAERYIYGRGARQDCDHGVRLLKTTAQSNPKAMISLGALYFTLCLVIMSCHFEPAFFAGEKSAVALRGISQRSHRLNAFFALTTARKANTATACPASHLPAMFPLSFRRPIRQPAFFVLL